MTTNGLGSATNPVLRVWIEEELRLFLFFCPSVGMGTAAAIMLSKYLLLWRVNIRGMEYDKVHLEAKKKKKKRITVPVI